MSATKTVRKATQREVIAIHQLLSKHLVKTERKDEQGRHVYAYDDDWSDARIAVECCDVGSPPMSQRSVENMRRELFGPLNGKADDTFDAKTSHAALLKRVEELERRLTDRESNCRDLTRIVRQLCDGLGVPYDVNTGT